MQLKLFLRLGFLAVFLVSVTACADSYADFRSVLGEEQALMDKFLAEAKQALEPESLKKDIDGLSAGLQDLAGKLKQLEQDHPELAVPADTPPELKRELDRLEKSFGDLDKLLLDKEMLFRDPKVEKSLKNLADLRGSLGL
jgi:hypothetical protein